MYWRVLLSSMVLLFVGGSLVEAKTIGSVSRVPVTQQSLLLRLSRMQRPSRRSIRSVVGPGSISLPLPKRSNLRVGQSSSSSSSVARDTLLDTSVRSNFLLLGEVSPLLAGVRISLQEEPLDVRKISVVLMEDAPSVETILVYKETGEELGLATRRSSGRYELDLKTGTFILLQRKETSFYVRARLRPWKEGGESGQSVRVSSIEVRGNGVWSADGYTRGSTETFPIFVTTRGTLLRIENVGGAVSVLTPGTARKLASFRFTSRRTDGRAEVQLSSLTFQVEQVGGVTFSNIVVRREGTGGSHTCTVSGSIASCSGLASAVGVVDSELVLSVYGDIAVPVQPTSHSSLRLTLNDPGTPSQAGGLSFTDGTSIFSWVPFDQPVAEGTLHSY